MMRHDSTSDRERYHILLFQQMQCRFCTHNHSSSLKGRALQPMNVTHQHANLTHSLIDAYGRAGVRECVTINTNQSNHAVASRLAASSSTSVYLGILTHNHCWNTCASDFTAAVQYSDQSVSLGLWDTSTRALLNEILFACLVWLCGY